jgi:hypothetical protein
MVAAISSCNYSSYHCHLVRLNILAYLISHGIVFFFHDKSVLAGLSAAKTINRIARDYDCGCNKRLKYSNYVRKSQSLFGSMPERPISAISSWWLSRPRLRAMYKSRWSQRVDLHRHPKKKGNSRKDAHDAARQSHPLGARAISSFQMPSPEQRTTAVKPRHTNSA